jgi:hypothetical protein
MSAIARAGGMLLGFTFLISGALKSFSQADFVGSIHDYGLTSEPVSVAFAVALPGLEIVLGVAWLVWRFSPAVAGLTGALLLTFSAVFLREWAAGSDRPCGCFGEAMAMGPGESLARNSLLLLLVFLLRAAALHRAQTLPGKSP